jgi:hypothetical protein
VHEGRAQIRERIDRVLAREEFRQDGNALAQWVDERLRKIARWFGDLLGLSDPGSARLALQVLLVLVGIALVWAIARLVASRRRPRRTAAGGEDAPSSETQRGAAVAALRREARRAAESGQQVTALRLYFRALVLGLSERGELHYRDAWTNRELLERGAPRREVLPLIAPLVPRLDAQSFGKEPVAPTDVARMKDLCDRLLGGLGA